MKYLPVFLVWGTIAAATIVAVTAHNPAALVFLSFGFGYNFTVSYLSMTHHEEEKK